jgi:hypothetical protein
LAGKVEVDVVDAVLVVVVEEQVSGDLVDLVAAQTARVFGGFAVQQEGPPAERLQAE